MSSERGQQQVHVRGRGQQQVRVRERGQQQVRVRGRGQQQVRVRGRGQQQVQRRGEGSDSRCLPYLPCPEHALRPPPPHPSHSLELILQLLPCLGQGSQLSGKAGLLRFLGFTQRLKLRGQPSSSR